MITEKHINDNYARLYAIVMSMVGNPTDTEDVLQESIERIWMYRDRVRYFANESPAAWMITVTKNHCKNWLAKSNKRGMVFSSESAPDIGAIDKIPSDEHSLSDEMLYAFNNLSNIEKKVFKMYYFNGYKGSDIADEVGIRYNEVKQILFKGRKVLRNSYAIANFDSTKENNHDITNSQEEAG
jgi:RNA polymerase sigma factor (sigma-70 family)